MRLRGGRGWSSCSSVRSVVGLTTETVVNIGIRGIVTELGAKDKRINGWPVANSLTRVHKAHSGQVLFLQIAHRTAEYSKAQCHDADQRGQIRGKEACQLVLVTAVWGIFSGANEKGRSGLVHGFVRRFSRFGGDRGGDLALCWG